MQTDLIIFPLKMFCFHSDINFCDHSTSANFPVCLNYEAVFKLNDLQYNVPPLLFVSEAGFKYFQLSNMVKSSPWRNQCFKLCI